MVNIPLLRKTLEQLEAHPEDWDQGTWVTTLYPDGSKESYEESPAKAVTFTAKECGTSFCFAGMAANLAGWNPVWLGSEKHFSYETMEKNGDKDTVCNIAERELGLNEYQSGELFYAGNDIEDVRAICESFAGGPL